MYLNISVHATFLKVYVNIFKQRMLRELKYWKSYEYLIFLCLI